MKTILFILALIISLPSLASTHTLVVCGNMRDMPFPINKLDSMDSFVRVGDTIQRKLDHLRDIMEHVFFSTGLREAGARDSYVVSDHGSTANRNFVINNDFVDIFVETKRKLKYSSGDEAAKRAIIAEADAQKVIMQLVIPPNGTPAPRYNFTNVYSCFTKREGTLQKTIFVPSYDSRHNFQYPDQSVEEEVCTCACFQVKI